MPGELGFLTYEGETHRFSKGIGQDN